MSDQPPPGIDPSIAEYYQRAPEEHRLEQGPSLLESLRTRELIERQARPPPATVVDVGRAAGAYALWLANAGYTVHLVDPVPRLVAEAQRRSAARPRPLASCRVGDGRDPDFPAESADMVLLLGPLYHLTESADRARGLSRDLFHDPRFASIVERDLREGQYRNPTERLDYFSTAYFHRPDELGAEVAGAGLNVEGLYGVEGPGWLLSDVAARLADPRRRADLLQLASCSKRSRRCSASAPTCWWWLGPRRDAASCGHPRMQLTSCPMCGAPGGRTPSVCTLWNVGLWWRRHLRSQLDAHSVRRTARASRVANGQNTMDASSGGAAIHCRVRRQPGASLPPCRALSGRGGGSRRPN